MPPRVIDWDGASLPAQLRELPPGRYAVEPVDLAPTLTVEEEDGILAALDQIEAGRGIPLAMVLDELPGGSAKKTRL